MSVTVDQYVNRNFNEFPGPSLDFKILVNRRQKMIKARAVSSESGKYYSVIGIGSVSRLGD